MNEPTSALNLLSAQRQWVAPRTFRIGSVSLLGHLAAFAAALVLLGCSSNEAETDAPLKVNEVCPSNQTVLADESGQFDDWIEIYNPTDAAVSLAGYTLSDHADQPFRVSLPADLVVPAKGVLLLWADDEVTQGPSHLEFKLKATGEGVFLSGPSRNLVDSLEFTAAPNDQSYSRIPDGSGTVQWCGKPTPNMVNGSACGK